MNIGYARVSTLDQNLALQQYALTKANCDRFFTDTASGAKADRPGQLDALSRLRKGDTLVVWKLDRLCRSLKQLIEVTIDLEKKGVGLKSLQEQIDTTPGGKLVFHVFGVLAEFERDLVRERTNAGLTAARARGKVGGRKAVLTGKKAETADNNGNLYGSTQGGGQLGNGSLFELSPSPEMSPTAVLAVGQFVLCVLMLKGRKLKTNNADSTR